MKYFDFVDTQPTIGALAIIEGTERILAERALETLLDRVLPAPMRDLNLEVFEAADWSDPGRVRAALQAMPFLADRRVVVVDDAQILKVPARRELLGVAQNVPDGNTLVILDLLAPRSQRPQSLGSLAGRTALRIDTTATDETRARFIAETLETLGVSAEPRALGELNRSAADLASLRNDLAKLALAGRTITYRDLEEELVGSSDPKAYKYASAVVEGKPAIALAIAHEMFANDPRSAAIPLLNALASECGYVWEMARTGGQLPTRVAWREGGLRPLAKRVGERRARVAYDRAVRGIEGIVTGQAGNDPEDHRTLVERITVELSQMSRHGRN